MMKNIMLSAAFFVGSSSAIFAQATMPAPVAPAPVNPLQQRVVPAAPAPAVTSPAPMATPTPAPAAKMAAPKSAEAKPAKAPGAKNAGAARRKQCSEEYQTAKKANTLAGQTWPKFYSACNTRLKAAGQ
jgi:hypothetical protein